MFISSTYPLFILRLHTPPACPIIRHDLSW
jgi:hypothetical protein